MAANALSSPVVGRTPNPKSMPSPSPSTRRAAADVATAAAAVVAADSKVRFEAYNRLQAAAVAFGEKLPIPEIVTIGGQSDGKSSLLEALLGFRFNVREVEMGTRRPLVLQMVHDPTTLEPRCRFQEDSEEYGSPMVLATAIADLIKQRTDSHLRKIQAAVSSKPIVMRAEYAHCPNLTIIDTPGFVLKAKRGEPESTPEEIRSMVKSLASPPHRLVLFLQQSSVEWCSSVWLDTLKEIDPTFRRTMIVISKFDNRLKEFTDRWEVDTYLSASGYLGDNIHPFFVALPKDRGTISNEEFRRQICQVDIDVLRHLRDNVKGGFNEEKYGPYIGFSCLRKYLESELQKRYKEAAPATLALLEQRCSEVSMDLSRLDSKLQATSDVSQLRRSAMLHAASICTHLRALLDGAADPAPEIWGKTTGEEQMHSGIGSWPGINMPVKPANSTLKLYGGAAFERVMHEFRCATYSMEYPQVSREKVANILLAHAGRGGSSGLTEAASEIARAAARSWLAPLIDTACDRLAFVLQSLFDLAMERNRNHDSKYHQNVEDMDGYVGFLAALRCSYYKFVKELSKQCKQIVRHHLDSVTSPYSHICYESDFLSGIGSVANSTNRFTHFPGVTSFDLSDSGSALEEAQENMPPKDQQHMTPPTKGNESKEVLRENQLTVPETPSPDLPADIHGGKKKDNGIPNDGGPRKRHARMAAYTNRNHQNNGIIGADDMGSKTGSSYSTICAISAQYFAKMREVLIERNIPSALNSGFLTPCREKLFLALGFELFAVNDDKFMDMFVAPGAVDAIQNERQSLLKRQKVLLSCLNEFKNISRSL
ncbi:dynamin-related protein 5A-like isoform X2 [Phragmites australis]|uniref:dynamin-related protein 5A-like isoform X2 n=1 Tax=Phragmites australis TaxID=29695 RepID=UPI002D769072|nr:dynamin-related protein 5A-like isoform X2 [Phragmites australis]